MSPGQSAVAAEVERSNPFPGLRTFEPDEDYLFFGREEQIDELLRRLRTTRFLSILGSSGSGKSSLVRAGLVPALHRGRFHENGSWAEAWRVAIFRPGDSPFRELGNALRAFLGHPLLRGPRPQSLCRLNAGRLIDRARRRSLVSPRLAPQVGFEPTTLRLTAGCSTAELLRTRTAAPTWNYTPGRPVSPLS
jgi:hypothetical protein